MSRKKRILISNEFSQLATGFSTYMGAILPYLYATGKYEIAELACYCHPNHPLIDSVPWKVYPNEPDQRDQAAWQRYSQDPMNQFGKWKFDEAVVDFQPDIVISISDPWMMHHIAKSPFRDYYKFVYMPTCDGTPQKQEYLDDMGKADVVLAYSLWAKNVIEGESHGKIKVTSVASPGCDLEVFKPLADKDKEKSQFGLPKDSIIFGTVMRNQPRKLFPEIMRAFVKYMTRCEKEGNTDLLEKSFLYFHSSFPDVGWAFNEELKRHNLSHKVIFTYVCHACGYIFPNFFSGETCTCKACHKHAAKMPNTAQGVPRPVLAKIMGMFDLYVQHSIAAGWEMPINDAKACGVFCAATEYAAMQEQCYNGGAVPIPVKQFVQEPVNQTNQLRAWANNAALADIMYDQATASSELRSQRSKEARDCVEKLYDWKRIAGVWETVLDGVDVNGGISKWYLPANIKEPRLPIPPNLNNQQFVEYCIVHVLNDPSLIGSQYQHKMVDLLNAGYENAIDGFGRSVRNPITHQHIFNAMISELQNKNSMEQYRYEKVMGISMNPGVKHLDI